jgi:hypothetical protein
VALVTNRSETVEDIVGTMVSGNTETNITVTYSDNGAGNGKLDFSIAEADVSSTLGVATFNSDDFNDNGSGLIELEDTVVKGISTDSGALTPSSHAFTIQGGEGIDVTHSSTTVTVSGELASTSNLGIASFTSADFDVAIGVVSLEDSVVKGVSGDSGSITPSSHSFSIIGSVAGVVNTIASGGSVAIGVSYDDSTIGKNGSNQLYVPDNGIDTDQINGAAVTEAKLDIYNSPMVSGVLGYTSNGMEWINIDTDIEAVIENDIRLENKSAECDGGTTGFTLDHTPVDNSVQVYLNGLLQEKGAGKDYTQSGTSITFDVAPVTDDILIIHYVMQA